MLDENTPAVIQEIEWPITITLIKPVFAHDKELTELVLQEPNGGMLMSLPLGVEGAKDDSKIVLPLIDLSAKMAGVPPSTIKSLSLKDSLEVMKVTSPLAMQCLSVLGT